MMLIYSVNDYSATMGELMLLIYCEYGSGHNVVVRNYSHRIFTHSLKGEARKRISNLPDNLIKTLIDFHDKFLARWGTKKDI
jgi:hypothetical protein